MSRTLVHTGLLFKKDDAVIPKKDVVFLRPSVDFMKMSERHTWRTDELGFIIEIDNSIEETGEILLRILTPYYLGWTDSWSVKLA